jgi:hypothetical protein
MFVPRRLLQPRDRRLAFLGGAAALVPTSADIWAVWAVWVSSPTCAAGRAAAIRDAGRRSRECLTITCHPVSCGGRTTRERPSIPLRSRLSPRVRGAVGSSARHASRPAARSGENRSAARGNVLSWPDQQKSNVKNDKGNDHHDDRTYAAQIVHCASDCGIGGDDSPEHDKYRRNRCLRRVPNGS